MGLSEQNLLDYSLLLGIHRLPETLSADKHKSEIHRLQAAGGPGAYVSLDRQKVYFFGIIDVLERYNLRWKMQNLVLRSVYCCACKEGADGISAMPPQDYGDRFRTFMDYEVLQI